MIYFSNNSVIRMRGNNIMRFIQVTLLNADIKVMRNKFLKYLTKRSSGFLINMKCLPLFTKSLAKPGTFCFAICCMDIKCKMMYNWLTSISFLFFFFSFFMVYHCACTGELYTMISCRILVAYYSRFFIPYAALMNCPSALN